MTSAWSFRTNADRHAVPIEMRFIDLFMAALGALIFMAMLLAFLLRFLPMDGKGGPQSSSPPLAKQSPLQMVSSSLPPAVVGEPYEMAFAYRGGSDGIGWQVPAGAAEIPAGLKFDDQHGVLSGTPTQRSEAHFVVQVSDARGQRDQKPFELIVESPRTGSKLSETVLALAVNLLLGWFWRLSRIQNKLTVQMIAEMQDAWKQGRRSIAWKDADGTSTYEIKLPDGIAIHQARLQAGQWKSRVLLFILIFSIAWSAWRILGV